MDSIEKHLTERNRRDTIARATDPANAPAAQVPTREEVLSLAQRARFYSDTGQRLTDAIIALYAPHIARLERERDEARWKASAKGRRARIAEAAFATAEAEGMRKAAGIASAYATKSDGKFNGVIKRARHGEKNLELAAATAAGMDHAGRNIAAAILAAIPKGK